MWHELIYDPHRRHLALTVLVGAALAAYLTGSVTGVYGFDLALVAALAGGFPIFLGAARTLARRQISADLAVGLAALAALYIGQYAVAAEVVFIMLIGEALEHFAVGRTRSAVAALLGLRPQQARVRRDGQEQVVPARDVRPGDIVLVRPGDRIPADGRVLAGHSSVDQSSMTGEPVPADKAPGDEVLAGTINVHGALDIAAERVGADTALEHIIHLVEEAEAARAPTQRLADRYAAFFVPVVLAAAAATYYFTRDATRAVAVLVVACPCALVLATPTAIAAGIGALVRRGVLVKGGAVLETLARLRSVVFDKTGTLTLARLRVGQVAPAPGHSAAEVVRLGAAVEQRSEHPLGRVLVEQARRDGLALPEALGFKASPGLGAEAAVEGALMRVGNVRFLQQSGVGLPDEFLSRAEGLGRAGCTVVLVARGQEVIGAVGVEDTVRPESRQALERLRGLGVARLAMLTGDHAAAAQAVARTLGIDDARGGLLPAQKVEAVRAIQREAGPVAMVGDGINDAPSLAAADVGIAMADIGTDVAIASAGVVLVGSDLAKVADAVALGRKTLRIIWQNIFGFALVFNALAVAAASLGYIGPVEGAVLHQVSSLTVVLNSMRLLVDRERWRSRAAGVGRAVARRRRPILAAAAAAAAVLYALSGLHIVRVGEVAVVQHFGRIVDAAEPAGLHYRLPYPFGRHYTVRPDERRRVEIGFRTIPGVFAEPPTYEWNVQHRGGRYERQADEATVWTGDEAMADSNLVIHYRVRDPLAALFVVGPALPDGADKWDALVRAEAEAALRAEMSGRTSEDILSAQRTDIEEAVSRRLADALARCAAGFQVEAVCLGDVHPPVEVVPAFRDVAAATEEKDAAINTAEAYQYETEALARGQGRGRVLAAEAAGEDRVARAEGGAARFVATAAAARLAPAATRLRLYLATIEELLAGRRKVIVDRAPPGARRILWLGRQGIIDMSGGAPAAPTAAAEQTTPAEPPVSAAPAAPAAAPAAREGAPSP
ncbi:MAG: cation-translocating P-type ATPase family protein [Planctomycetes bacterium]|nr:cation-translocating P-type ATPase family protein [Planctomycetota bacterium]